MDASVRPSSSLSLIPPGTGGVRDYAEKLGSALDAPVTELSRSTDTSTWSGDMLLLHFSGYGFHNRGIPLWLTREMRTLRQRFRVFGVIFHELYASGPPWSSAFWLRGTQERIARDLLLQADFWLTNRDGAAEWLHKTSRAAPHRVLPVFSNMGEPAAIDLVGRDASLVVFGSAGIRAPSYAWNDGEIFGFARREGLQIHDIGPPTDDAALAERLAKEGVVVHGRLPAEAVSAALSRARFGAIVYPPDHVAKSGIFAAYASHGTCPILLWKGRTPRDGLQAGINYANSFENAPGANVAASAEIGRAARQWYEPHSIAAHVDVLKNLSNEARP